MYCMPKPLAIPDLSILPATDLAYLAGLLDGEGYIGVHRVNRRGLVNYFGATVVIGMTDEATIDWVDARFPGGRATRRQKAQYKVVHLWSIHNARAAALLTAVLPYLVTKRRQAELVIAFGDDLRGTRGHGVRLTDEETARRLALYEETRQLNHRGAYA